MPHLEELPVPHHQQDGTFYCGPATAQMLLLHAGAGLIDQSDLDAEIQAHNSEPKWATAPDGLLFALNGFLPTSTSSTLSLFQLENVDAISRKIVWTIKHSSVGAAVLVRGGAHWVVVNGFETTAEPLGPDDTSYSIISFDINNPSPALTDHPPPPHGTNDGCGQGGTSGMMLDNISYSEWRSSYMLPVSGPSLWEGKYVAIGDTDPPPTISGTEFLDPRILDGELLATAAEAKDLAVAGLAKYGLPNRQSWQRLLGKTIPGEPLLVQRLDRRDSFYYIVPMKESPTVIPVLVLIDARFGNYLQSARVGMPGNALQGLNFDPQAALQILFGNMQLTGRPKRMRIRKEAYSLYPTLVWRPCRESMSPYIPFFMVTVGNRRLYIRVDGKIFTSLHTQDRGSLRHAPCSRREPGRSCSDSNFRGGGR